MFFPGKQEQFSGSCHGPEAQKSSLQQQSARSAAERASAVLCSHHWDSSLGEEQQKQDAVIFSLFLSLGGGSAVFSQRNQCVIIAISRRRNHTDICGDTRKGGFVQYCFKPAEEGLNVVFQQAAFLHEMGFRFHRRGCHSKCD